MGQQSLMKLKAHEHPLNALMMRAKWIKATHTYLSLGKAAARTGAIFQSACESGVRLTMHGRDYIAWSSFIRRERGVLGQPPTGTPPKKASDNPMQLGCAIGRGTQGAKA